MELSNTNIWEIYAPLFDKFTPKMSKELLLASGKECMGKVIDFGCGSGKLWDYLNWKQVESVKGIEKNLQMKLLAQRRRVQNFDRITIENIDLTEFKTNERYNTVVSLNVLYTQPNLYSHLSKAYDLLKFGGKIICSSPNNFANMQKLSQIVDTEFEGEDYNLFKKCNYFLSKDFSPKLYSLEEIIFNLNKIGFQIEISNNNFYAKSNFFIIAEKKK